MLRYVFNTKVLSFEERRRVIRGYKNANGDAIIEDAPDGYYIVLDGFKAAFRQGDKLETSVNPPEHMPIGANARLIIEIEP